MKTITTSMTIWPKNAEIPGTTADSISRRSFFCAICCGLDVRAIYPVWLAGRVNARYFRIVVRLKKRLEYQPV